MQSGGIHIDGQAVDIVKPACRYSIVGPRDAGRGSASKHALSSGAAAMTSAAKQLLKRPRGLSDLYASFLDCRLKQAIAQAERHGWEIKEASR